MFLVRIVIPTPTGTMQFEHNWQRKQSARIFVGKSASGMRHAW
jgi:hypothetical protein